MWVKYCINEEERLEILGKSSKKKHKQEKKFQRSIPYSIFFVAISLSKISEDREGQPVNGKVRKGRIKKAVENFRNSHDDFHSRDDSDFVHIICNTLLNWHAVQINERDSRVCSRPNMTKRKEKYGQVSNTLTLDPPPSCSSKLSLSRKMPFFREYDSVVQTFFFSDP